MRKRILSLALALCLGLGLLTVPAGAAANPCGFPAAFQGDGFYLTATPYELQDEGWAVAGDAFHEGLIRVEKTVREVDASGYYTGFTYQRVGYADKTGKVVLTFDDWEDPPTSPGASMTGGMYFQDGMCLYYDRTTDLYGYVNTQGEPVIPAQYRSAEPFRDGVARVRTVDGGSLIVGKDGQVAVDSDLSIIGDFGNGLAAATGTLENGDYFVGFVDKQGQSAITLFQGKGGDYSTDEYLSLTLGNSGATVFSEGYAILEDRRGGRTRPGYVVIDTQDSEVGVIDAQAPVYVQLIGDRFSDGLVFVKLVDTGAGETVNTSQGAYVDIHGNVVFRTTGGMPGYEAAAMTDGLAIPRTLGAMIDREGNVIIPSPTDLEELWPDFGVSQAMWCAFSPEGIGLAVLHDGLATYHILLEKHDGTYTGPGVVYDAATGTIRDGGTAPVDPEPSADQPSSWAVEQVNAAIAAGLVPESLQSRYTQTATRAEFCALAVELYETVTGKEITARATFSDTSDVNVQKMAGVGGINGVGGGKFDPDGQLTREQAATILSRLAEAMGRPLPEAAASFADNASIASWAMDAVGRVQAGGLMDGVGGNLFSPQGSYTREQSILTILRLYELTQG